MISLGSHPRFCKMSRQIRVLATPSCNDWRSVDVYWEKQGVPWNIWCTLIESMKWGAGWVVLLFPLPWERERLLEHAVIPAGARGNQAPAFYHSSAFLAGRRQLFFSGVSFAGTGEQKHCKTNTKTEQGSCYFFVPVSRERESESCWTQWCLRVTSKHFCGHSQLIFNGNPFFLSGPEHSSSGTLGW